MKNHENDAAPAPIGEASSEHFVASQRLAGLSVLLVDDGPDNQALLGRFLTASGATVEFAANGAEAVEKARNGDHDVVLMDMEMPVVDGYTAARSLRAGGYLPPIVALTAHSTAGEREKCLAQGCSDYLAKPFKPNALVDTIERVVRPERTAPAETHMESEFAGDPILGPLIANFVKNLPSRVAALSSAQERSDWSEIENLAHQMAGAAGGYGFPAMGRIAAKIEMQAKDKAPAEILATSIGTFASLCSAAARPGSTLH